MNKRAHILLGPLLLVLAACMATGAAPAPRALRVALMDFSTDDNSWRNSQAAANFTSLLQIQLANEPGVEWVERAQLDLAKQELKLSEMELIGGSSPIRRGKWAKADWLVTGRFSLDDKNQRTLGLEVTDLQHADVLASQTITFPGHATAQIQVAHDVVELAATALRQLLADARRRQQASAGQVLVAPLFLVDISRFGFGYDRRSLQSAFYDALERAAATNRHLRLIRFPKAYQAMDESEMVLDGLVEANRQAWQQTADLYVWGTYCMTNDPAGAKPQNRIEITLHCWDGDSQPQAFKAELPLEFRAGLPATVVLPTLDRLVSQVLDRARKQAAPGDSAALRHEIAESISSAYLQPSSATHWALGVNDNTALLEAVHMLETACFFDPDNSKLHELRISCRWGSWLNSRMGVKNVFWSYWRRGRAWGRYVDRFGLQPNAGVPRFPYQEGVPELYVRSLEEALGMFPQRYDADEDHQQQRAGVFTAVMEAQAHGFPKDIPREVVLQWKAEVEAELADRRKKVSDYSQSTSARPSGPVTIPPRQATSPPPTSAESSPASKPTRQLRGPSQYGHQPIPSPGWLQKIRPQFSLFKLSPPGVLPSELKPALQEIRFPSQFEVRAVLQVALCRGKLLILAMDERSAPSSDASPDMSAELLNQRGRLWSLDLDGQIPALFEAGLLPGTIHTFLLEDERLWVAGESIGCLDLKARNFRQFGLREGMASQAIYSLTLAGGRLYAAGDRFDVYSLDPGAAQWQKLGLPRAKLSSGTGNPALITGNSRWLEYVAGSALLYDVPSATWTNLEEMKYVHCVAADDSSFWFGSLEGLHRYELGRRSFESWHPPASIRGLDTFSLGPYQYIGQPSIPEEAVNKITDGIRHFISGLQKERARVHLEKRNQRSAIDPLHLDWRMPADVTALANDGDFLWLGTGMYSDGCLLLVHKPSLSLVGYWRVEGRVRSLAVSERDLWVGAAYGKQLLTRIQKQPLLAIPRSRWLPLAISPDERARLVNGMPLRNQALYAFYAGDDARVAQLLGYATAEKATLEEMFLLAFAYDASGLDKPEVARAWFERISSRYPDSPWAAAAQEFLTTNDQNHKAKERQALLLAKYDRNHDGVLDQAERRAMEQDSAYQREESIAREDQLATQLPEIFKKFDSNGDSRLDREELELLRRSVLLYSGAVPEILVGRKILLAPLLTKDFPSVDQILKKYDINKDGALDAAEFKALAADIHKGR